MYRSLIEIGRLTGRQQEHDHTHALITSEGYNFTRLLEQITEDTMGQIHPRCNSIDFTLERNLSMIVFHRHANYIPTPTFGKKVSDCGRAYPIYLNGNVQVLAEIH